MKLFKKLKRELKIIYFDYCMNQHLFGGERKQNISNKYIYRLILKKENYDKRRTRKTI